MIGVEDICFKSGRKDISQKRHMQAKKTFSCICLKVLGFPVNSCPSRKDTEKSPKQSFLLLTSILNGLQQLNCTCQFTNLNKGVNNSQGGIHSPLAFKNCGQHVQPPFSKSCRGHLTEFQPIKVVKNFDHLFFFILIQLKDISRRELLQIVTYCLVNLFSPHAIQYCHITIKQDWLITSQSLLITRMMEAKFRRLIRVFKKYSDKLKNRLPTRAGRRFCIENLLKNLRFSDKMPALNHFNE